MDYLAIQILAFVKANPGWAMLVIGLTAFGESFVFLSLLFPGTAILIAAGTLVSEGILSPVPTVVAGIAGAVLGDSVSFWLGQKFGPLLPKIWPFRTHPERLMRSTSFFKRYGVHSVIPWPVTRGRPVGGWHDAHAAIALQHRECLICSGLGASACAFR